MMCSNMPEEDYELNKHINDALDAVEKDIMTCIKNMYNLTIKVSIQVLHSSQSKNGFPRQSACNERCQFIQENAKLRKLCDDSDTAMKHYLDRKVRTGRRKDITIGYRCHQYLSNIIMPIKWGDYFWYIFLGQFLLRGCGKSLGCPECIEGFRSENIEVLKRAEIEADIEDEYKKSVRDNLFYIASDVKNASGICSLEIPELLVCKVVAKIMFNNFLSTIHDEEYEKFKKWLETYGKEKKKEPTKRETSYPQQKNAPELLE